jgi:hypothetical protein
MTVISDRIRNKPQILPETARIPKTKKLKTCSPIAKDGYPLK